MFLPDLQPDQLAELIPSHLNKPRYNIAPTQSIACIGRPATGQPRQLFFARWGLLPSWASELSMGARMINARSETVESKPSFKHAFARRRCLIIADGYYEWLKTDDGKQPYLIGKRSGQPMALAGLWETNKKLAIDGQPITSCTILTTNANRTTRDIHDRMPVILNDESQSTWLDPDCQDVGILKQLLVPADEGVLETAMVSKHVNNARNDDPKCVEVVS